MFQRGSADPPLAGPHAAPARQFRCAPVRLADQLAIRHVFAAAHQCVVPSEGLESRVKGEGFVQRLCETLPACPARPQALRGDTIADGAVAGDGAFHQRQFAATETGAFTGGVMVVAGGRLPRVHS